MTLLLRKDRAWVPFFLTTGLAIAAALFEHSFTFTFVVAPDRHEVLFHFAWISGLLLGAVAACFDEALGTRDLLEHRPIAARSLAARRVGTCLFLLATWFVVVPAAAYIAYAFAEPRNAFGPVRHLPEIWSTLTVAVSACGIGFAAGSLPLRWLDRLACAGALLWSTYSTIHWLSQGPAAANPWATDVDRRVFALLHVGVGLVLLAIGARAGMHRRDADRPLPHALRIAIVAPLVVLIAPLWCMAQMELEASVVRELHAAYPRTMVDGSGDHAMLIHPQGNGRYEVVDTNHAATRTFVEDNRRVYSVQGDRPLVGLRPFRVEPPRGAAAREHGLVLDTDGSLWRFNPDERGPTLVAVAGVPPSSRRVQLGRIAVHDDPGHRTSYHGVVHDPDLGELWAVDPLSGRAERTALSDGDTFLRFSSESPLALVPLQPGAAIPGSSEELVVGERFAYAWRDGTLHAVARVADKASARPPRARTSGDVLEWTVVITGKDGVDVFSHAYEPRLGGERALAALAMVSSLLRPPVAQAAAFACGQVDWRWHWLADPLVSGSRRAWLVAACMLLAAACTWCVRRWLRVIGAPARVIRFWTVATLLLGVFAAVCSVLCERRRAYACRAVPSVPAPRILTKVNEEVLT